MFDGFDFALLDDPQFKEDAVREELIAPLLKALGYSAGGPYKIIRSKSLKHPFVYIGTKKYEVKITPDYLLVVNDDHRWILDAKAPTEIITSGKNVQQAFSYAIHPDVRAFNYVLCNGRQIVVFDVRKMEPILVVNLREIEHRFEELRKLLCPLAFLKPKLLEYKPDLGVYLLKLGFSEKVTQHFVPMGVPFIAMIEDNLYTATVNIKFGEEWLCASFDFDAQRLHQLLSSVPSDLSSKIANALRKTPFRINLGLEAPELCIQAHLSEMISFNEDEEFCPFIVDRFEPLPPK